MRKLKTIDRRLDCRWVWSTGQWEIGEWVNWLMPKSVGVGKSLYRVEPRWQRVIYAPDLGSRVLDYVRRCKVNRFSSMEQMVDELNIDK